MNASLSQDRRLAVRTEANIGQGAGGGRRAAHHGHQHAPAAGQGEGPDRRPEAERAKGVNEFCMAWPKAAAATVLARPSPEEFEECISTLAARARLEAPAGGTRGVSPKMRAHWAKK